MLNLSSILSQRHALLFLTLLSRSMMAYRNMEIKIERTNFTFDPRDSCYLSKLASTLLELKWPVQSFRDPPV